MNTIYPWVQFTHEYNLLMTTIYSWIQFTYDYNLLMNTIYSWVQFTHEYNFLMGAIYSWIQFTHGYNLLMKTWNCSWGNILDEYEIKNVHIWHIFEKIFMYSIQICFNYFSFRNQFDELVLSDWYSLFDIYCSTVKQNWKCHSEVDQFCN